MNLGAVLEGKVNNIDMILDPHLFCNQSIASFMFFFCLKVVFLVLQYL
jgi:hypothetical protein